MLHNIMLNKKVFCWCWTGSIIEGPRRNLRGRIDRTGYRDIKCSYLFSRLSFFDSLLRLTELAWWVWQKVSTEEFVRVYALVAIILSPSTELEVLKSTSEKLRRQFVYTSIWVIKKAGKELCEKPSVYMPTSLFCSRENSFALHM